MYDIVCMRDTKYSTGVLGSVISDPLGKVVFQG